MGLKIGVAYPIRSTRLIAHFDIRSSIKQKDSVTYWLDKRLNSLEKELLLQTKQQQSEVQDLEEMRILGLL